LATNSRISSAYGELERLGATAGSVLYRGRRTPDGAIVLLKIAEGGSLSGEKRLRRELAMLRALDVSAARQPVELLSEDPPVLVLADFAGQPLGSLLDGDALSWPRRLQLAAGLAAALEQLHARRLVHRDVRPANFLVSAAGEALVLDFSRAVFADREPAPTEALEGTEVDWAYVSPEQTGRLDRPVDQRTDLYALGVTLYRLFSGALPFTAADPLEWSHCHLARLPRPLPKDVPAAVAAVVMALLGKDPEDRPQSARAVRRELERCLASDSGLARAGEPEVSPRCASPRSSTAAIGSARSCSPRSTPWQPRASRAWCWSGVSKVRGSPRSWPIWPNRSLAATATW
jgi:serine/threonine protein kinase